jgi:SAM-dependent methyltransferase
MIATARERAAALGLGHVEFRVADVTTVELAADAYDAVLARWSLIYMHGVPGALARLRRALAPGGYVAVTAWAPPEVNPWLAIPMAAVGRVQSVPPADPQGPGPFHLSADGALARTLLRAGFQAVQQERVVLSQFAHTPEEFWGMMLDMAGPLAPLVADLSADARAQVAGEVAAGIGAYRAGDVYRIPAQAQLAWGRA